MTSRRLLFVIMLSSVFAYAQTPAPTSSLRDLHAENQMRATSKELWKRHSQIYGSDIPSENTGPGSFAYVHANEQFGHLFESCLKDPEGAVISVGTFRGLNLVSGGKAKDLVLFDYDSHIKLFNLVNLQLILKARDRYEYMSLLLTGKLNEPLIFEAKRSKMSVKEFITKVAAPLIVNPQDPPKKWKWKSEGNLIPSAWAKLGIESPNKEDWETLNEKEDAKNLPESEKGSPLNSRLAYQLLNRIPDSLFNSDRLGTIGDTLFGDDNRFSAVQKMIHEGHVSVVQGDLTKAGTMKAVNDALKAGGSPGISAIDVSNVPSYAAAAMTNEGVAEGDAWYRGMKENWQKTTFTPNARIFFTNHNTLFRDAEPHHPPVAERPWLRDLEQWYYYSLAPKDLEQMDAVIERIKLRPKNAYQEFQFELDASFRPSVHGRIKGNPILFVSEHGDCP